MNHALTIDPAELLRRARDGDRLAVAKLVTATEQGGELARRVGEVAWADGGEAYTLGVTGAPGSGKSTLTDRLITRARAGGRVAVLAIDPSSPFSGGAILGDRVRMGSHHQDDGVFIRSMATRGHMGGLSLAVPDAVRLLGAAGMSWVIVETVGVGQVEVEVAGAADTTVVVMNPGWGDSVQAAKAGLMEVADVFVVNKADRPGVNETVRDIEGMLNLSPSPAEGGWRPPVVRSVAPTGEGLEDVWEAVMAHREHLITTGRLAARREGRIAEELRKIVERRVAERVDQLLGAGRMDKLVAQVVSREIDPYAAAEDVLRSL